MRLYLVYQTLDILFSVVVIGERGVERGARPGAEGIEEFSKGLEALVGEMGGSEGLNEVPIQVRNVIGVPRQGREWLLVFQAHEEWPLTWGRRRFPFL